MKEDQRKTQPKTPRAPLSLDEQSNREVVAGRNAVRELLRSGRAIDKIFLQKSEDRSGSILMLLREALERKIPVVEAEKAKLDALSGGIPHQGKQQEQLPEHGLRRLRFPQGNSCRSV